MAVGHIPICLLQGWMVVSTLPGCVLIIWETDQSVTAQLLVLIGLRVVSMGQLAKIMGFSLAKDTALCVRNCLRAHLGWHQCEVLSGDNLVGIDILHSPHPNVSEGGRWPAIQAVECGTSSHLS